MIACREKMFQHEIPGRCISGFTLLEVMAAVAMLSIVMAGVYRLHSQTVMMHQRARFYVTASFLAQQKLSQLETAKISELTEDKGDFGKDFEGYTWRVKVGEVEGDTAEALGETVKRLKKIQLGVLLNDGEFTLEIGTSRFFTG